MGTSVLSLENEASWGDRLRRSFERATASAVLVLYGCNVAATALIANQVETAERGRAIGINDSCAGAMSVVAAIATGPLIEWGGLPAAGMAAVAIALVPLAMALVRRR